MALSFIYFFAHYCIQTKNEPAIDGPSSSTSTARDGEDTSNHVGENEDDDDDDDDDLDLDELNELEASLSKTTLQIKEPGNSAWSWDVSRKKKKKKLKKREKVIEFSAFFLLLITDIWVDVLINLGDCWSNFVNVDENFFALDINSWAILYGWLINLKIGARKIPGCIDLGTWGILL